jgi:SSS family solute:Na+ symporter
VAAQIKALGLIFSSSPTAPSQEPAGMILGAAIVLSYTIFGGMFSVAILDFVQMAVSMGGMLFIAWTVSGKVGGGATAVIDHASAAGKLKFFPTPTPGCG